MILTPWDFIVDLGNPLLVFLPKALIVAVACSIVAGVIGSHVVLRGMAFVGDAVAHSVFPALAIAFLLQGSRAANDPTAPPTTRPLRQGS